MYARLRRTAGLAFASTIAITAIAATALGALVDAGPWFATKATSVPVLLAIIALPSLSKHRLPSLGAANSVTLSRSVLVGLCAAFFWEPSASAAAWPLFAASSLAFVLDWVDGRLARATGQATPFGARLDMELDAITIVVLCGLVWHLDRAGAWVFASGGLRYLFVACSLALPWMTRDLYPTNRRRFTCGVQVTCLLGALIPWPVPGLAAAIAAFGLVCLVGSFAVDVAWLWKHRQEPL